MVVVDDLGDVGQLGKRGLETGMVIAWSAVKQDQRGLVAHGRPIRHQASAFDIDVKPYIPFYLDMHEYRSGRLSSAPWTDAAEPGRSNQHIMLPRQKNSRTVTMDAFYLDTDALELGNCRSR
jgi:hypothetical protein